MRNTLPVIGYLAFTLFGCTMLEDGNREDPLARVFESYLFPSEIEEAIPAGTSAKDSVILAKRYIDTWVKDQLMLHHAEQALTVDQKDFDRQLAEYHKSLLIYSYRQKLLQQKLDTLVSDQEILAYYNENISNFVLGQDVIRGIFIKVTLSAPRLNDVRRWSRSNSEGDLEELGKYCFSYADKFDNFKQKWIYLSSVSSQLPPGVPRSPSYYRYNRNIEASDSLSRYFLHISGHLPEGETAPLEMVHGDIAGIILNKRKIKLIHDLEQRVYEDGMTRNQFEIYQ